MFWKSKSKSDQALDIIKKGNNVTSANIYNGVLMVSTKYSQASVKLKAVNWTNSFTHPGAGNIHLSRMPGEKGAFKDNTTTGDNLLSLPIFCQTGKEQELLSLLQQISSRY